MADKNERPIIIIRKIEEAGHGGHHGGGWKVAYADFMTAMMAFFLLMWILGATDEDQRKGIADYFAPTLFSLSGGIGEELGASTNTEGLNRNDSSPVVAIVTPAFGRNSYTIVEVDSRNALLKPPEEKRNASELLFPEDTPAAPESDNPISEIEADITELRRAAEGDRFEELKTEIVQAIRDVPELSPLVANLIFDKTEEGLRIQIIDQEGQSMFALGSAKAEGQALNLMTLVGQAVAKLPNDILITGHTDSRPYAHSETYSNWELSADRANATRRIFVDAGIDANRILRISGLADTVPLKPDMPRDASNRRISVVLQYLPDEFSIGEIKNRVVDGQGHALGTTYSDTPQGTISLGAPEQ